MEAELIVQLWENLGWFGKTLAILLLAHPVASAIVALTPTPVDDKYLRKFYGFIRALALNIGKATDKGEK